MRGKGGRIRQTAHISPNSPERRSKKYGMDEEGLDGARKIVTIVLWIKGQSEA
jgi:hypothetical protein